MQLSSTVLEMIDSPALSIRDAHKIFNVKFNVEYSSILRTTDVPKPLNTFISPGKQKELEALGKRNSKIKIFLLLRKSFSHLLFENILFLSLSLCPFFFLSFIFIYF